MQPQKRRVPCFLCAVTLGVIAAVASAQAKSHDALATARHKARHENQRVLLLLTGGGEIEDGLVKALGNYRGLGKLLRYEYQLAAQPAASVAGRALRQRLRLGDVATPTLAVLDTDDKLLGSLGGEQMAVDGAFTAGPVEAFLKKNNCSPRHARKVLAEGIAAAKKSKRKVFVYLSAPW